MKIRSRIERLEEEILPPPPQPPRFINVQYVDSEKNVVSTVVVEVGRPIGRHRRPPNGLTRGRGGW